MSSSRTSRGRHGSEIYRRRGARVPRLRARALTAGDGALPELPLGQEPRALLPRRASSAARSQPRRAVATSPRPLRRPSASLRRTCPGPRTSGSSGLSRRDHLARADVAPRRPARGVHEGDRASKATFKVVVDPVPLMQLYAQPFDRWEGDAADPHGSSTPWGTCGSAVLTTDTHAQLIGEGRTQTFGPSGPVGTGIWEVIAGPVATKKYAKEIDEFLGTPGSGAVVTGAFFNRSRLRSRPSLCPDRRVRLCAGDGDATTLTVSRGASGGIVRDTSGSRVVRSSFAPGHGAQHLRGAPRHCSRQGADRVVAARPLPLGMTPFALLLLVRDEGGGYGEAGIVVAVYTIALGIGRRSAGGASICSGGAGAPCGGGHVRSVPRFGRYPGAGRRRVAAPRGRSCARGLPPPADRVDGADRVAADRPRRAPLHGLRARGGAPGGVLRRRAVAGRSARGVRADARGRRRRAREPRRHDSAVAPPAGSGDAVVAHLGRRIARRARSAAPVVLYAAGSAPRSARSNSRCRPSRSSRPPGARRDRARLFRGGEPARRTPRGMYPPRDDVRRFLGGALALGAALLGLQLAVSLATPWCWPSSRACRSSRPSPRSTPRSTARHAGTEPRVRLVRHGDLDRVRGSVGGARRPRRGAERALGVDCGAVVASGAPASGGCGATRSVPSERTPPVERCSLRDRAAERRAHRGSERASPLR